MGQVRQEHSFLIPFFLTGEFKSIFLEIEKDPKITCFQNREEFHIIFYKINFLICGERKSVNEYVEKIKQLEYNSKNLRGTNVIS
jgi:hypothetical protein